MIHDLPEKLLNLRVKNGYSQKQLAVKLGLSPSIISAYEKGERTPSVEILLSLSYLYHCSVDYLLGRKNLSTPNTLDMSGLTVQEIVALMNLVEVMKAQNAQNTEK